VSAEVSPTYDEIMERSRRLADGGGPITYEEIGPSELGRPIPKLTLGDAGRDLPLLMVTGGTHGSEETGRAASMALAEWISGEGARQRPGAPRSGGEPAAGGEHAAPAPGAILSAGEDPKYLDRMTVVIIPCVNPDGAILNTYHNAKDVNVYTSHGHGRPSETAEGRAVEAVAEELIPDCYVDVHGLAGGGMGGSEYIHPRIASGMGLQIGFAVAAEMDAAAVAAGIPQRRPVIHGGFRDASGPLGGKLASETNALAFTLEITEKYYPLADSVRSGLERLKVLVDVGTRTHYCQPYPGFPCDLLCGGPMFALMAYGSSYRQRRESRPLTMAAILESTMCNFGRSHSDAGGAAELTLSFDDGTKTVPEGVVMQAALDPRARVRSVSARWPDGPATELTEGDGYSVWLPDGGPVPVVRCSVARPPAVGENRIRIEYDAPFSPHDPPGR